MNIFLWILQVLLALHTAMGGVWKFSNTPPTLQAIPHPVWLAMGIFDILCAVALILPAFHKPRARLAPIAAVYIVLEMFIFCGVHQASGDADKSPMVYWLVVAGICAFVAYGRFVLKPFSNTNIEND